MASPSAAVEAFWRAFIDQQGEPGGGFEVVAFGDDDAMATELADLVVSARKRATAALLAEFADGAEAMPVVGGHVVMVDGSGAPRCVWRTVEVKVDRLDAVDDAFAWDEGEGDRTRDWWLAAHRSYFSRIAGPLGIDLHDGIETVFERFRVIWPPALADPPA